MCLVKKDHPRIKKQPSLDDYLRERRVVGAPSGTLGSLVDSALEARGLRSTVRAPETALVVGIAQILRCRDAP